jgi:hypothetical protein
VIRTEDSWSALARQPRVWASLARHAIPVAGILLLGWSPVESIVSVFLGGLSALYCLAGIAAYFVLGLYAREEQDWLDRVNSFVGGLMLFAFVAALLTFTVGVLAFMLWVNVFRVADLDLRALASQRSLWLGFAGMLLCQVPRFVGFVAAHDAESARGPVQAEIGFQLRRLALITLVCGFLVLLPGRAALIAAVILTQGTLAAIEIRGDRLLAPPHDPPHDSGESGAAPPPLSRRRKRAGKRGRRGSRS